MALDFFGKKILPLLMPLIYRRIYMDRWYIYEYKYGTNMTIYMIHIHIQICILYKYRYEIWDISHIYYHSPPKITKGVEGVGVRKKI